MLDPKSSDDSTVLFLMSTVSHIHDLMSLIPQSVTQSASSKQSFPQSSIASQNSSTFCVSKGEFQFVGV